MSVDYKKIQIVKAKQENENHRNGIWNIRNENLGYTFSNNDHFSFENHCKWWENVFKQEYVYLILYKSKISGYIRLTKIRTILKEKNEISIAIIKNFHNTGMGSYALKLFEEEMKKIGITEIIANTDINNELGKRFFEKNDFNKTFIRYLKKL